MPGFCILDKFILFMKIVYIAIIFIAAMMFIRTMRR